MNQRTHIACTWAGPLFVLFFVLGLFIAGDIPPPSPSLTPLQIATIFKEHTTSIQIGLLIVLACQGLYAIFCAELTVQMRRIEGEHSPLAFAQLGLAVLAILLAIVPMMFQLAATFRINERSDFTFQLLSDLTWLPFIGAWFTVVPQWAVTGIAILQDTREQPIFPRWSGYANLWFAVLSLPSTGLYFLKVGPFAWDGMLAFWLAGGAFFGWAIIMTVVMLKAIRQQYSSP